MENGTDIQPKRKPNAKRSSSPLTQSLKNTTATPTPLLSLNTTSFPTWYLHHIFNLELELKIDYWNIVFVD